MTYTTKVALCSEIRTKHSTQSKHHVEFCFLNLVVRKETARLWKVNVSTDWWDIILYAEKYVTKVILWVTAHSPTVKLANKVISLKCD